MPLGCLSRNPSPAPDPFIVIPTRSIVLLESADQFAAGLTEIELQNGFVHAAT